MPGGSLLPHMSARLRTETVDALFLSAGGPERALAWINKSDENYGEFFLKVWAKGAARAVTMDHTVNKDSVESLLDALDQRERGKVPQIVDSTAVEVIDAT